MVQLDKISRLKEKKIREEQKERESIDQIYKETIIKAEQEKVFKLEELSRLKEKKIS